ncbi:hypothetical protein LTS18_009158 [Coniosporium uncinatum]|uniref:Uncharacterized protein n=1 Tax=Coniosporium uncinatum TaxID=93489 RepID=A0ACC3D183_9PEZI|nr:hypothetical protein LTS18_009158 [Coniosporium uncinatum]
MNSCGAIPQYLADNFEPLPEAAWQPLPEFPQKPSKRVDSVKSSIPAVDKKAIISCKNDDIPLLSHEINTNFLHSPSYPSSSSSDDEHYNDPAFGRAGSKLTACPKERRWFEDEGYYSGDEEGQQLVERFEESAVKAPEEVTNIVVAADDDEEAWEAAYGF